MDPIVARKKLLRALQALFSNEAAFEEYDWELVSPEIYVQMHPRGKLDQKYVVRITFEAFPDEAASYVCVNSQTKALDGQGCPPISAYKADWPGFCLNGTKEFYKKGHPERTPQWTPEKYPIALVLQEIQVELNKCG
jgi:hypothetical protein